MASNKAVFGIANSEGQAVRIVEQARAAGFTGDDISVLFPDKGTSREFAHERQTKAPEGAATGAATVISSYAFHWPQVGHWPTHFGERAPQLWHTYAVLIFATNVPFPGSRGATGSQIRHSGQDADAILHELYT